jgi:hypothetical protein
MKTMNITYRQAGAGGNKGKEMAEEGEGGEERGKRDLENFSSQWNFLSILNKYSCKYTLFNQYLVDQIKYH